jgi:PAS domain S-box-containing protein
MGIHDEFQVVENLLQSSSDVLCALDHHDHLWGVSVAGQRVLGYAPDELHDVPFRVILHPADHAQVEAIYQAARQQTTPVSFEGRCLTKTGQEVALAWSAFRWPATELLLCVGRVIAPQPITLSAEAPAARAHC